MLAAGLIIGVALDRGIESRLASSRAVIPAHGRTTAVVTPAPVKQPTRDTVVPDVEPAPVTAGYPGERLQDLTRSDSGRYDACTVNA